MGDDWCSAVCQVLRAPRSLRLWQLVWSRGWLVDIYRAFWPGWVARYESGFGRWMWWLLTRWSRMVCWCVLWRPGHQARGQALGLNGTVGFLRELRDPSKSEGGGAILRRSTLLLILSHLPSLATVGDGGEGRGDFLRVPWHWNAGGCGLPFTAPPLPACIAVSVQRRTDVPL
jgi:hypothetical protein